MLKRLFLNEKFILVVILINAVLVFISGFIIQPNFASSIQILDNLITALFIIELIVKSTEFGFRHYLISNWNKLDAILIILSIPAFVAFIFQLDFAEYSFLLVLRILRVFKSFRFLKFVPDIENLIKGVQRALKSSFVVLIGFAVYIFIVGIFTFYIFKSTAPEYFGNPMISLYTTFKIFTVEGWFEIPENITSDYTPVASFFTYMYFIFILISGGIFGLSLVNSIFVDAMVSDNNDDLEKKIVSLENKVDILITQNNTNDGISK